VAARGWGEHPFSPSDLDRLLWGSRAQRSV